MRDPGPLVNPQHLSLGILANPSEHHLNMSYGQYSLGSPKDVDPICKYDFSRAQNVIPIQNYMSICKLATWPCYPEN